MLSIYDLSATDQLFRARGVDPARARRLRNAWFKKFEPREAALAELAPRERAAVEDDLEFHALALESRHDSRLDAATKLIFRTPAGFLIEAVILRIASGRTALCLSSQVGCAARCDFCATGKMGIAKSLSTAEILDQVVQAGQIVQAEGRQLRNLVFMGMGEPLHNEANLYPALDALHAPRGFARSPRKTLVSTVGVPEAMRRLAARHPEANLALSLHSARQSVRERIIPLAVKHPLDELRAALTDITADGAQKVMIEYLMLSGVNDTDDDLAALIDYLAGLPVHVNLIPYNPIDGAPHLTGTPAARREAFAAELKRAGFATTIRYSLGADIAAACGQLVRRENRQIALAARPS
jgi:23S rRNA (adenine2503-C2)-methyltransferase